MASLPVMGLLANNHLGARGLFTYLSSSLVLRKSYVPFVDVTETGSGGKQITLEIASKASRRSSEYILSSKSFSVV